MMLLVSIIGELSWLVLVQECENPGTEPRTEPRKERHNPIIYIVDTSRCVRGVTINYHILNARN